MTLIASYGGPDSNAYIDVTQANSFIRSAALGTEPWFDLSNTQKQAALMMATRDVDSRQYIGHRFYYDQALEFPRQMRSAFPFNRTSTETISQDVNQKRMRDDVQRATALQALKIAKDGGRSQHLQNIANGIKGISESVGPIREFVQYGQRTTLSRAVLDPDALSLLQEWMTTRKIYRK